MKYEEAQVYKICIYAARVGYEGLVKMYYWVSFKFMY